MKKGKNKTKKLAKRATNQCILEIVWEECASKLHWKFTGILINMVPGQTERQKRKDPAAKLIGSYYKKKC